MQERLYEFLDTNIILFENQFDFAKKNSTLYAFTQITNQIKTSIKDGKYGCGMFIERSKNAFDTVNQAIILRNLEHCGVRGIPLQWLQSAVAQCLRVEHISTIVLVNIFESRWFCRSGFEFAKTPLSMLSH